MMSALTGLRRPAMHRLLLLFLAAAGASVLGLPEPRTPGPRSSGPQTPGPWSSGPQTPGPRSSGPRSSGPQTPGPRSSGPRAAGPCLAPSQWEGRWVMYDHSTGRNSRAAVSYDGLQQRVRVLQQNKKHTPCQRFFEYIYLYQSRLMFQIDQKTKECSKTELTEAWDAFDIPQNSTFEDQYVIGGPRDQLEVQEWSDRKPARQHETWVGVYTLKDCFPVQETYVRNSSVTTSTRFFSLQLGISDPDVFTPPPTCQSARPHKMADC